jgi:hypothetical protein
MHILYLVGSGFQAKYVRFRCERYLQPRAYHCRTNAGGCGKLHHKCDTPKLNHSTHMLLGPAKYSLVLTKPLERRQLFVHFGSICKMYA